MIPITVCCVAGRFGTVNVSALLGRKLDFEVLVPLAPERQARQPVFAIDGLPGSSPLIRRKDAGGAIKIRALDGAADAAGRNQDPRIIADALVLPHIVAGHEHQLAIALCKPHGRAHGGAVLAEGGERDVFLTVNLSGDGHQICIPGLRGLVYHGD